MDKRNITKLEFYNNLYNIKCKEIEKQFTKDKIDERERYEKLAEACETYITDIAIQRDKNEEIKQSLKIVVDFLETEYNNIEIAICESNERLDYLEKEFYSKRKQEDNHE